MDLIDWPWLAEPAHISAGIWLVGIALAAIAVTQVGEKVNAIARKLRGLPPVQGWEHCEHCDETVDYAHNTLAVLEEIRDNTRRTAATLDELAADEQPAAFR